MDRRQVLATMAAGGLLANTASARRQTFDPVDPRAHFRQGYVDTPSGQVYFWTAGRGANVTFIHQSGNSSQEYRSLVPLLKARCRMIAMDLPGHGRSADPAAEPTVDDYTAAVSAVLDHLDVARTHLVGHHGGALTAMNIAATEPERIRKTILSGIGGLKSDAENQAFIDSILSVDTTVRTDNDFVSDAWDRYVRMMSDGATAEDILTPFVAFLDARLRPYRGVLVNLKWDRRPALEKLKGPVLLVQGSLDTYVSNQASLLDVIPSSTRLEMPGCGTFMFYDRAQSCATMVADYLEFSA